MCSSHSGEPDRCRSQPRAPVQNTRPGFSSSPAVKSMRARQAALAKLSEVAQVAPLEDALRWQAIARLEQQHVWTPRHVLDAVEQTSPNQVGLAWQYLRDTGRIAAAYDGRPPDVQDAATALHSTPTGVSSGTESIVSRPPDVHDAAVASRTPVEFTTTGGFDWGDWAIGLGSGMGLAVLLGVGLVVARQYRHRVQPA
jgi:hypothetical protein